MEYTKPFLTFEEQADLLMKDRGMVADRDDLIRHLQDVGYYRLSGYWHIHKKLSQMLRICRCGTPLSYLMSLMKLSS